MPLATPKRRFIDVRQPGEFAAGHIEGSELVPLSTLASASSSWDRNQPLTVVCRSGQRAERACAELRVRGFRDVTVLPGGVLRWSADGGRLVVEDGNVKPQTLGATMSTERGVRFLAGSMILISLALAHWVSPNWLFLTLFVGLNLFQSSLTAWCPAEKILRAIGFGQASCSLPSGNAETAKTR